MSWKHAENLVRALEKAVFPGIKGADVLPLASAIEWLVAERDRLKTQVPPLAPSLVEPPQEPTKKKRK